MLNLLLKQLKIIARNKRIYGYKSMSKYELWSIINTSKPIKNNRKEDRENLLKSKREKIRIIFQDPRIKEDSKIGEIERIFPEPGRKVGRKNLFKPKKYYDNNSGIINYKGFRNIRTLYESVEDYYKSTKISNTFSSNWIWK